MIIFRLLLILLMSYWTSFTSSDVRNYHIKVTSVEEVKRFESKFPFITNDRAVYIAYLHKYANKDLDTYTELIR